MSAEIVNSGRDYITKHLAESTPTHVTRFVLANVPGLDHTQPVNLKEVMPPIEQVVYNEPLTRSAKVGVDEVVYSQILMSDVGDFDFNWIGLTTDDETLIAVVYVPTQYKRKYLGGQIGNSLTRNIVLKFAHASQALDVTIAPETWQLDMLETIQVEVQKALAGHDHDERYYSQQYINDLFATKSELQGAGAQISEVARFARDDVHFVSGGSEWLQSGYITQDFALYPDAHVHKTLFFDKHIEEGMSAYSPSLKLWVHTYVGKNAAYAGNVHLSSDDWDTKDIIQVSTLMDTRSIIWSEFHRKFFVASHAVGSQTHYLLSSPDGRTWVNHPIVNSPAHSVVEGENGRIFVISTSSATAFYSDDGFKTVIPANAHSSQRVSQILNAKEFGLFFFESSKVYRSTDNGETFALLSDTIPNFRKAVYSEHLKTIVVGASSDLYNCTDGIHFVEVGNKDVGSVYAFTAMAVNGEDIFAISSKTIYHSTDGVNFIPKESVSSSNGLTVSDNVLMASSSNNSYISKYWFEYIGCANATNKATNPDANAINDYVRIK